jgi:hypothetical protein
MDVAAVLLSLLLGTLVAAVFTPVPPGDLYEIDVRQLATGWAATRLSPTDPSMMRHSELKELVQSLVRQHPEVLRAEKAGVSLEGREIFLVSAGSGPDRILLWSQMHGDEPTATSALIDLMSYIGRHREEPWVARVLGNYTLLFVPMLNPDGAERGSRRNRQGLDINRDARALQTPEGRLLRDIRDRNRPFLGFNLHNQSSLTTVGDTGREATIALLAVAADRLPAPAGTSPGDQGLLLTRRVASVIHEALSPFVRGRISRYDEQFNPRAFGDNMTMWGTPVVLIESGGQAPDLPPDFAVKLSFVAICAALDALASGRIANADPAVYDSLQPNSDSPIFDLLLRDAWIFTGNDVPLFRGDVAIRGDLRSSAGSEAIITDVGDLGVFTAHRTLDCSNSLLTPGLIGWDPGSVLDRNEAVDESYLRSGFTTVLQTVHLERAAKAMQLPSDLSGGSSAVNRGFVVMGDWPRRAREEVQAAQWMGAGSRAWICKPGTAPLPGPHDVAGWFGMQSLTYDAASRYEVRHAMNGNPEVVLRAWTSEAAGVFRIPRRGLIAPGAAADLVLWKGETSGGPFEMSSLRPCAVILNGRLLDRDRPEPGGRFFGR